MEGAVEVAGTIDEDESFHGPDSTPTGRRGCESRAAGTGAGRFESGLKPRHAAATTTRAAKPSPHPPMRTLNAPPAYAVGLKNGDPPCAPPTRRRPPSPPGSASCSQPCRSLSR
ncbi:hypothetical protein LG3211_5029 [Lysobacter gummosus]|nr:hypothetical protein LG3211_5029 [Lysobacter gummosus]